MKIQKFDDFVNEEVLPRGIWDDSNNKALKSWTDKEPDTEYVITTNEPIKISTTDDVELAKIKMLFFKHKIKFEIEELELVK